MVLLILLLLLGRLCLAADPDRNLLPLPVYEATRPSGPIVIDGKLDEEAWAKAKPVEFVFPWKKQNGPKQKTTARILWDDKYLYIGYECADTDIEAQYEQRDDPTYKDDAVEAFINPVPSSGFYIGLEMNARGTLYDYFNAYPVTLVKEYQLKDAKVATTIRGTLNQPKDKDEGWSLEVAIPWENFRAWRITKAPKPGSEWRINLNRWDGTEPKRRLSQWSDSAMPTPNPHNPVRFGRLIFR